MQRGMVWRQRLLRYSVLSFLLILGLASPVAAQGLPQSPYSAPSVARGGLDLARGNPLGLPGSTGGLPRGSDSIYLTDRMFRDIFGPIPNLQVGYLHSFGSRYAYQSRLTLDYLLPVTSGDGNSAVFGELHGEFRDFWASIRRLFYAGDTITTQSGLKERTDLSFGGGYRTLLNENTLLGVNGFFDTAKLGNRWYSSGSVGFEMAARMPGNDALDLSFNWYGNLLNSNVLANAFREGPQNYDFQAGYSHELWSGGPDLRLSATGYRFSSGSGVFGYRGGAELKTRDGMFSVKYEVAHDRLNQTYHTVGGFANVGIRLSNLLNGESPFVMPEPIFRSPRNLRRLLTKPVHRDYYSRRSVVAASCPNSCSAEIAGITITGEGCGCEAEIITTSSSCYAFSASGGTTLPDWIYISRTNSAGDLRIRVYTDSACTAQLSTVILTAGPPCVPAQAFIDPSSIKAFSYEPFPLGSSSGAGCVSMYSSD